MQYRNSFSKTVAEMEIFARVVKVLFSNGFRAWVSQNNNNSLIVASSEFFWKQIFGLSIGKKIILKNYNVNHLYPRSEILNCFQLKESQLLEVIVINCCCPQDTQPLTPSWCSNDCHCDLEDCDPNGFHPHSLSRRSLNTSHSPKPPEKQKKY